MRLFEAILEANHRAVAGDTNAGIHPGDYPEELPIVALTCIDSRLNPLFPSVLGLPDECFIWLRNAGNIITSPVSSTMRSISLACAIKGGREIAIIGHTDCKVSQTTIGALLDRFRAMGINRQLLPENLTEYFGVFASVQQNVIHAVDLVRHSPLISPKTWVHGLVVDTATGKLDWLVNGYEVLDRPTQTPPALQMSAIGAHAEDLIARAGSELKSVEAKIGEVTQDVGKWAAAAKVPANPPVPAAPAAAVPRSMPASRPLPAPPPPVDHRKIPVPPKIALPSRPTKFRI